MASAVVHDGQVHTKADVTKYENLVVFKEPRCLIFPDEGRKLQIDGDVLNEIKQIQLPISVVTIAGQFRTGKSYLLNRLAGVKKGFKLGSTIKAETKGIWVWCRPHPTKDGHIILLMDTEGLGDIEKGDQNDDNHTFTLALLLSNTFIYNISGIFTAENVDKLAFVTEVSKILKVPDGEHMRNLSLFSPFFILTLRDFTLELKLEGREITSDEYLEDFCLSAQPEVNERAILMNKTRQLLKDNFNKRKCFIFAPPGGPKILQKIDEFQDESLDKDFVAESKKFTDFVLKKTPEKEIEIGQPINGERLAVLVHIYVETIRTGKIPNLGDALQKLAEQENTKAIEECVKIYVSGMNDNLTFPISDKKSVSEANLKCFWEAVQFFRSHSICDINNSYLRQAHEQLISEYENIVRRDEEESLQKSKEELKKLHAGILQNIENRLYLSSDGYASYKKDMENLKTRYDKLTGLGCKKNDALLLHTSELWTEAETILAAEVEMTMKETQKQEVMTLQEINTKATRKHEKIVKDKDQELKEVKEANDKIIKEKNRELKEAKEANDKIIKEKDRELKEAKEANDKIIKEKNRELKEAKEANDKIIKKKDRELKEVKEAIKERDSELNVLKEERERGMWNRITSIWPLNVRRS